MDPEWKNATFHDEIEDDVSPKIISAQWRGQLEAFLAMFLPVKKLLRITDSDKPTCSNSKVYNGMFQLGQRLSQSTIDWAAAAKECFDERWVYIHTPMHGAGYALDPEFLGGGNEGLDEWVMDGVHEMCEKMSLLHVSQSTRTAVEELLLTDSAVVEFNSTCHRQFQEFREQRSSVFMKPAVIANQKKVPAYKWWQMYCNHMPELQSVAVRVLSQVGAASIAERNWSIHGMIHNKRRTRLNPQRAIKLVFIHQTLRLLDSFTDPTWQEEPLPWHEQSSSDPDASSADEGSE
jgi:hypothetical protein